MDQPQLRELESRCIQEEQPFCTAACPIHVDVRAFMACLANGNVRDARKILDRTMPFPEIVGRLCDQPCRPFCKRGEIGDPLAIGRLEQYCVSTTQTMVKLPKLPAKQGAVTIIGAGLSGMTAALDLMRKGRATTLITGSATLGGSLCRLPESTLPNDALAQAAATLAGYGVVLRTATSLDPQAIEALIGHADAVYFDWDDVDPALLPLPQGVPDPLTLALGRDGCFAGGGTEAGNPFSVIQQVENGRRAALSIERFLQKVSLTAQRDKEGSCTTRMVTVTTGHASLAAIVPANPDSGYTAAEARAEASRCIRCECMECVKQCVYLRQYNEYPKTLVRKMYNNQAIVQGTRNANRMINACSLCGQCTVICPNDFPVAEVCRAARQDMVDSNHMPPSPHDFALEDMRFSQSEYCRLSRHQPGTNASRHLFYPGCQLAGSAPETVKKTYDLLASLLEGGVGLMLDCCGIPAHWAGQRQVFQQTLHHFKTEIERLGRPRVIVACSSCLSVFKEFTADIETISLWEVLDGLELPTDLPATPTAPLALHDPCTARRQQAMRASVRSLCAKLGLPIVEHAYNGELADCCGYGGLMQFADQQLGRKAALVKAERSEQCGLAYCAMCRDNLAAAGRPVAHLLDYLFAASDGSDPLGRANPGFSLRHENRVRLKEQLLTDLWGETAASRPEHTALSLLVSPEVMDRLNSRHILEDEARKVIHHAEATGRYLINPANQHRLACLKPVRVTYWIEYEPTAAGYILHNGYSHRMHLPQETP